MPSEVPSFLSTDTGSAAMKAPQDDEAGHQAIAIMAKVNEESCKDLVEYTETLPSTLAGATIVELGPGAGYATRAILAKAPASVTAFELSPVFRRMLAADEEHCAPAIASGLLKIKDEDALTGLSRLEGSSVDLIVSMNVVYFLHPLSAYLAEMTRVLKPGGWLVFGTKPASAKLGTPVHFVNTDNFVIAEEMTVAGFQNVSVASPRLVSDPPTPAKYVPVVGQKELAGYVQAVIAEGEVP